MMESPDMATGSEAGPVTPGSLEAAASSQGGEPRRWRAWQLAVPAGATLGLALWGITRASFWRDEAATLSVLRRAITAFSRLLDPTHFLHGPYYPIPSPVARVLCFGGHG